MYTGAEVIDELMAGQKPRVDPYQLILEDYIATWIEDIADGLRASKSRLYRSYRQSALSAVVAGMAGAHEDHLLSLAAETLHITPVELWRQLFTTALLKARAA